MKISDLVQMCRDGKRPVVTFKGGIDDLESYAEAGMRARIVDARDEHDDTVKVLLDFEDFETHNRSFESSNYYDKQGKPTLNAREAGFYKPQDSVCFMSSDDMGGYFTIDDSPALALFSEFKSTNGQTGLSYVQWLEQQVLQLRAASAEADSVPLQAEQAMSELAAQAQAQGQYR